jgi:hypothetical protein
VHVNQRNRPHKGCQTNVKLFYNSNSWFSISFNEGCDRRTQVNSHRWQIEWQVFKSEQGRYRALLADRFQRSPCAYYPQAGWCPLVGTPACRRTPVGGRQAPAQLLATQSCSTCSLLDRLLLSGLPFTPLSLRPISRPLFSVLPTAVDFISDGECDNAKRMALFTYTAYPQLKRSCTN